MATPNQSKRRNSITDLPADILYTIFPYLSASEYLNLTSSTRSLLPYRQDPTYWHALTRKTFRIPEQPLLQGRRWQWLYKKLLTQTRLFTWGDNKSENLGHRRVAHEDRSSLGHRGLVPRQSGWPRQPLMRVEVGVISDVQCGGWSTTLLNSIGQIFMFGVLDGLGFRPRASPRLRLLGFPPGYPPTTKDRYEPSTAIKQYSTGRGSVLGLSDNGRVWSWTSDTAVLVKSVHVDLRENKVLEVQTGWDRCSIYVQGVGIVYWSSDSDSDLLQGGRQQALEVADAILVDTVTIPGTGYRGERQSGSVKDSLSARIGEVTHYVVLETHIVFTTRLNKVFSYATIFPMSTVPTPEPVELTSFYECSPAQPFQIRDLQGSYRNFAVFTTSGAIITATRTMLDAYHRLAEEDTEEVPAESQLKPSVLPSLQRGTVVSLAFGDHHLHALHADGTLTSRGTECQHCGALGLGPIRQSAFRGVHASAQGLGDGFIPRESRELRTVWFEPLMEKWLEHMVEKTKVPTSEESVERANLMRRHNPDLIEAMGDYFEKEGRKWEDGVTAGGEMGGYFVLKVAAAGWHSAALVLVDDKKVEQARENHIRKVIDPEPEQQQQRQQQEQQQNSSEQKAQGKTKASNISSNSSPPSLASNETIDSPSEQLAKAVSATCSWLWKLGRRFLGLSQRDELRREAGPGAATAPADGHGYGSGTHSAEERSGSSSSSSRSSREVSGEKEDAVQYSWSEDELPRLRMGRAEAGVIPGNVQVVG